MTIRKQWLLVLTITAVLAVCINSLILSSLINKYFLTYSTDNYNYHVGQIEQLASGALKEGGVSGRQLSVQLESHLDDPIVSIKLYNSAGVLVASAEDLPGSGYGMMGGMMHERMLGGSEEVDTFEIADGETVLGVLHITRYSSLSNSMVSVMFKTALIRNSVISFGIVLFVLVMIGIFISRRMSRDLMNTASQVLSVDMGDDRKCKPSKVREIRIIQMGLETLQNRLKVKQMSRKKAVDELIHQTRTPLTILRTHLEGFEDGVIDMSAEEIQVCQAQISNISSIISNMSLLIDADRPPETIRLEQVEIHALLSQIIGGLKVQFEKKGIGLQLSSDQKITVETDRYKISQCIYNLLTNAYKFTDPRGAVELSYEASDTGISIRVRDTGAGIAAEDLPHLFNAYFRGGNASATTGDGLGLYVVKENIEQLGGSVNVRSTPGAGSEFTLTIPVR